jgi:hypothetical protein
MPMKLDEGWNQIQFNLSDFTRRAYGTNYIETLRISIHANCRIRRVYFSERLYNEEDLPDDFKLFAPKRLGSQNHMNNTRQESKLEPEKNQNQSEGYSMSNRNEKENYYQDEGGMQMVDETADEIAETKDQ